MVVNRWKRKRARDKAIREIEAKRKAQQFSQKVAKQAYFFWEADGKPEGKDDYYWQLATDKVKGKNIPAIHKPYYLLEKLWLEPTDAWISRRVFFNILGRLGNLALLVAVVSFIFGEKIRRNNEVFAAWQTITGAHEQSGSGGRIEALQFLNSRPWRFPWAGWTEPDWFWNEREQKCNYKRLWGLRWERQPLVGLSAPNKAYLASIQLCGAYLAGANLQDAILVKANLQNADLAGTNLQNTVLWDANLQNAILEGTDLQNADLTAANLQDAVLVYAENLQPEQIKSACFWEQAIYEAKLERTGKWLAIEPDNTNFIKELKQDTRSHSPQPPDCSVWNE